MPYNTHYGLRHFANVNAVNVGIKIGYRIRVFPFLELPSIIFGLDCGLPCNLFWDGHGEWSSDGKHWKPYISRELDGKLVTVA